MIVGGGILGLITAYRLVEKMPHKSILILEKNQFGGTTTLNAAGLVSNLSLNPEILHWTVEGQWFYANLQSKSKIEFSQKLKTTFVANNSSIWNRYINEFTRITNPNLPDWFKSEIPTYSSENAWYYNPSKLTTFLIQCLNSFNNVDLKSETELLDIKEELSGVILQTDKGKYFGNNVVLTTGPWLWRTKEEIKVKRIISFTVNAPTSNLDTLIYLPSEGAFLLPQHEKKKWLLSVTSNQWNENPNTINRRMTANDWDLAKAIQEKYMPTIEITEGNVFCDGYTASKVPQIEKVGSNIWSFHGGSGRGIRYAPAFSRILIEKMCIPSYINN